MTHISHAAAALGGDASGRDTILCPGPGHSPKDRSLSVKLDPTAPDGFLTRSHAGDDWRECRARRNRIGLSTTYNEIRVGRLTARKIGRRTIITTDDEMAWRERLPKVHRTNAQSLKGSETP
jgi:hypothetical protein